MDKWVIKWVTKTEKPRKINDFTWFTLVTRTGIESSLSLSATLRNVLKVSILRGFLLRHLL